jgi:alpha-methylacyl-CoA racemase
VTGSAGVRDGPLTGISVIELSGIGPGPFACSFLADLGADVVRIERQGAKNALPDALTGIGRRARATLALNLKDESDRDIVTTMISHADVLIEGFRPGVTERLGIGPEQMLNVNPRLVYVRLTGWGQDGPYAEMAGHDINYIGLNGALATVGTETRPVPPLNLVGDYGGGSMFAVVGALAALVGRETTGRGQVIDSAMIDGSAALMGPTRDLLNAGLWSEDRSSNLLDGGAPFYRTYRTADDEFMAVGALEPQFYSAMLDGLGLAESELEDRFNPRNWGILADRFSEVFAQRTRQHWTEVFDGTDACVTPVLRLSEVDEHPHNQSRTALREMAHGSVPSPAPRFSSEYHRPNEDRDREDRLLDVLNGVGLGADVVRDLMNAGVASWS